MRGKSLRTKTRLEKGLGKKHGTRKKHKINSCVHSKRDFSLFCLFYSGRSDPRSTNAKNNVDLRVIRRPLRHKRANVCSSVKKHRYLYILYVWNLYPSYIYIIFYRVLAVIYMFIGCPMYRFETWVVYGERDHHTIYRNILVICVVGV